MTPLLTSTPSVSRPATTDVLSADNRFALMPALRQARRVLGLSPQVLATLEAMLTCLPKDGRSRVVFASNATLIHRRNGVSDRTIRRHIACLADAGLLRRCDSPNAKRYSRRDPLTGEILRFGLDLAPLFDQADRIHFLADAEAARDQACAVLRLRIRAALVHVPEPRRTAILTLIRRQLEVENLRDILGQLAEVAPEQRPDSAEPSEGPDTKMTATNGNSVRHQQRSNLETLDKSSSDETPRITPSDISAACQFAVSFAENTPETWGALLRHSDMIATLLGISPDMLRAARASKGAVATAKTVLLLTEMKNKVRSAPAYFRAVTTGPRADQFDPDRILCQKLRTVRAVA